MLQHDLNQSLFIADKTPWNIIQRKFPENPRMGVNKPISSILLICRFFTIVKTLVKESHVHIMVPTGSDESKLRTFQGPFQDQISHYKDFYGEFHKANIPNTPHICGNFLLLRHHIWLNWISVLYFEGKLAKCAFWYRLLIKLVKMFDIRHRFINLLLIRK